MKMINSAFNYLMTNGSIGSAVNAYTTNCFAPFIEIDPNTLKCMITADKQFFVNRYNGLPFVDNPQINIYFNKALHALFTSFPYKLTSNTGDLNYNLVFEDLYGLTTIQAATSILSTLNRNTATAVNKPGIHITQEISSASIRSPIASIVFATALLPIVPTQTSTPKIYNSSSSNFKISGEPNIASIISDFEISISPGNDYRDYIMYLPTAEYRLLDMYSSYSLNKIDLVVFWGRTPFPI
jgi:hypothetical protein